MTQAQKNWLIAKIDDEIERINDFYAGKSNLKRALKSLNQMKEEIRA